MRNPPSGAVVLVAASAAYSLISACGWERPPTAPTEPSDPAATITITAAGPSRSAIVLPRGGRLTIVNRDGVPHDIRSDPHPAHDACPALNEIGLLEPGRAGTSGVLPDAGTCGLHDDLQPLATALHLGIEIR